MDNYQFTPMTEQVYKYQALNIEDIVNIKANSSEDNTNTLSFASKLKKKLSIDSFDSSDFFLVINKDGTSCYAKDKTEVLNNHNCVFQEKNIENKGKIKAWFYNLFNS